MTYSVVVSGDKAGKAPWIGTQKVRESLENKFTAIARRRVSSDIKMLNVCAQLHRMRTAHYRKIVGELIQILKKAPRCVPVRTETLEAGDVNIAHNLAGNESQAGEAVKWRRSFGGRSAVECVAEAIDHVPRKDPGLAHREKFLKVRSRVRKVREGFDIEEGCA